MNIFIITTCFLAFINNVYPLNILAIYPYHGKSHFIVFKEFLRELANRGHNLTVISHFPEKQPLKNYHDVSLAGTMEAMEDEMPPFERNFYTILATGYLLVRFGNRNCEVLASNEQVQMFVKENRKFDVILVEQFNSDCSLGIAHKLGAPVVATTSHILMPFHYYRYGIPYNPSYVSFHFLDGGTKPTLVQRIQRIFFELYFRIYYKIGQWIDQKTLAKYFDDIPSLEELGRDIKFLLLYHNFALTGSKLLPTNVKEVGGYHVAKAQPLSGDLKRFVEESEHGIIYISFGSLVKSSSLKEERIKAILEAMKEFPQRFIWKFDTKIIAAEKDKLFIEKWLPQVDILGHPKTLAFISHAGMGGTTEAIHFGVPMVAMPIFGDQPSNAASIEESGLGVILHHADLTKDNLVAALNRILEPKFQSKAKELSSVWHDRPIAPLEEAVFWTEFAARHPTLSFRSAAADVPFYHYLFLDVLLLVLLIVISIVSVLKWCCRISKNSKQQVNERQNKKSKRE